MSRPCADAIRALSDLLVEAGHRLPDELASPDALTPFGVFYRYEDDDATESLDRARARQMLRLLRAWVEQRLRERTPVA